MPWKLNCTFAAIETKQTLGERFPQQASKRSLARSLANLHTKQQKQRRVLRELKHGRVGPYRPYYPTYLPDVSKGYNHRQVGS